MCLKRLNYDRKELEKRREESQHEIKGKPIRLDGASSEGCGSSLGGRGPATQTCLRLREDRRGVPCHSRDPNLRGKAEPAGRHRLRPEDAATC